MMDIPTSRTLLQCVLIATVGICLSFGNTIPSTTVPDDDSALNGNEIITNATQKITATEGTTTVTETRVSTSTQRNKERTVIPGGITPSELKAIIFEEIQEVEEARRKCSYGYFYNFSLKSCEDCTSRCKSETDIEFCGTECYGYFQNEDRKMESKRNKYIVFGCIGGVIILLAAVIVLGCGYNKLSNQNTELNDRLQAIEDRNRGFPDGDKPPLPTGQEETNGPTDSNTPLVPN